ncbi:cyclic nucleotide-binding domain-containing protein [Curvibacter sp. APW13]|uniref:Crp/Fnr family transcriptional regulator n=1 Tax=Curvibacter sp. APW13 TaxID=3077236 RepID=UPI0028DD6041|nr:cyclic nucleotide-binding domain-containing protein [Curvibacter sp. APW13]MDT8991903.1 cyclic nucleotide-binding domain-containing protein [Curvibacter sp. APW13]
MGIRIIPPDSGETPAPVHAPATTHPSLAPVRLEAPLLDKIAAKVPVFAGMPRPVLEELLASARRVHLAPWDNLFEQGQAGQDFFVLLAGEVSVTRLHAGQRVQLARLGPGECVGEMALVRHENRSASVTAIKETVALQLEQQAIDANSEAAHHIYRNIARILAARLSESSTTLTLLASQQREGH